MRRKDKAVTSRKQMDEIIHQSLYCVLACSQNQLPYQVPISFGYDGQALYLHTAQKGKKIDIFEAHPQVCAAFVSQAELITHQDQACNWSFRYASVIVEGKISEITDPGGKRTALNLIMDQYSNREWEIPPSAQANTRVWKIEIETITGKASPTP
jgi:nitroimidazol reductase NimA-like FMN-containing flavoprotein (pyridoxamine 5'-phosphate oxidase superfamily)